MATTKSEEIWPSLPLAEWRETCATLQLWMQIVGKIRLAQAPLVNHWWQVPLYLTARGLTTSPMPFGALSFQIDFDFIDHRLVIATSEGRTAGMALEPRSVADFYRDLMAELKSLGIVVKIWTMPVEIPDAIPFEQDRTHAAYDRDYANRFWRILVQGDRLFTLFRSRFIGKVSPVHFFWGSFDLAVTRFSGRRAPVKPDADRITRETVLAIHRTFVTPFDRSQILDLITALDDPDPTVRFPVTVALGEIGPAAKAAVPRLKKMMEEEMNDEIAAAAKRALRRIQAQAVSGE